MDIRIYFFLLVLLVFCSPNVNAQSRLDQIKKDRSAESNEERVSTKSFELKRSVTIESREDIQQEQGEAFQCEAGLVLEYEQHDDEVKVQTFVSVDDCQNAHGEYVIKVYLDDDSGEFKVQKFTEVWRHAGVKSSDEEIVSEHSYSIDSGSYVSRVRGSLSSSKGCWCRQEIVE